MGIDLINSIWPEWKTVRELGQGSYGSVFEVVRDDGRLQTRGAVKIITIPHDEGTVKSLVAEGMTLQDTNEYFRSIIDDFVKEIDIMESFKGVQNIVSIEDYKVVEKNVGFDIYIRMELLTPLNEFLKDHDVSEEVVIKLGLDLCSALERCAQRSIIHRDIKPENIFVNSFGDFKLGDFGVARKLEDVAGTLTSIGTVNYMAPEVKRGDTYNSTADIYSLGLVLYRLLNRNRLPFLDLDKQLLTSADRQNANRLRFSGEKMSSPANASPEMASVILKACEYSPSYRYQTAAEMKNALENIRAGKKLEQGNHDSWNNKTFKIEENQSEKKILQRNRTGKKWLFAAIPLILIFLAAGGLYLQKNKPADNDVPTQVTEEVLNDTDKSDVKESKTAFEESDALDEASEKAEGVSEEKIIQDIVDSAQEKALNSDLVDALALILDGLNRYPESEVLLEAEESYKTIIDENAITRALEAASDLVNAGNTEEAVLLLENRQEKYGNDVRITEALTEYKTMLETEIAEQSDEDAQLETADVDNLDVEVSQPEGEIPAETLTEAQAEAATIDNSEEEASQPETEISEETQTEVQAEAAAVDDPDVEGPQPGTESIEETQLEDQSEVADEDGLGEEAAQPKTEIAEETQSEERLESTVTNSSDAENMQPETEITEETTLEAAEEAKNEEVLTDNKNTVSESKEAALTTRSLISVCPPYQYWGAETGNIYTILGDTYANTVRITERSGWLDFNLKGRYTKLSFDVGHIDGYVSSRESVITIECDGETVLSVPLKPDMNVAHYDVVLEEIQRMTMRGGGYGVADYTLANVQVTLSGKEGTQASKAKSGTKSLLKECPPYQYWGAETGKSYAVLGDTYVNTIRITERTGWLDFNLKGKYAALSFDVGHIDGCVSNHESVINIECDGEIVETIVLTPKMDVTHYEVTLAGVERMTLRSGGYGVSDYTLFNVGVVTTENEGTQASTMISGTESLLKVCSPYQYWGAETGKSYTVLGDTYANAIQIFERAGWLDFNLKGRYATISFDVGHIDWHVVNNESVITVECDGEIVETVALNPQMPVTHYEVDLAGAERLTLRSGGYGVGDYVIFNVGVTSSGYEGTQASTMKEGAKALLKECPAFESWGARAGESYNVLGDTYANTIRVTERSGWLEFMLNGKYTTLMFDMGHIDGNVSNNSGVLIIECDGEIVETIENKPDMPVEHHEISVSDVQKLTIRGGGYGIGDYVMFNIGLE